MKPATCVRFAIAAFTTLLAQRAIVGQVANSPGGPITKAAAIEKLGPNLYRLGSVRVDTANREVSVSGKINPNVSTLEFVANTRDGWRAYESAVSVDTDAITFNAALVLIGLDGAHAKGVPKFHFDPAALVGDVVTISLECPGGECQRMPAERVMFDQSKKEPVTGGRWIYTGSSFLPDGHYLADMGAVVIGFVHDPATVIEYSVGAGLGKYGQIVVNPNLGLAADTAITLTVKAASAPSH
jgi:hypothetical protein